jgi:hypothetical protein
LATGNREKMKKRLGLALSLWLILCCLPFTARAGEVPILEKGAVGIRGLLPDAWREMSIDERQVYLRQNGKLLQSAGKLLNAFQRQSDSPETAPVLFVFHASADKKVPEEQREKIYDWFKKNSEVACLVAPAEVKIMALENIEYLHDRNTIIFDTSVEVGGRQLHGVSGIIFLDQGYLNIIGYEADHSDRYRGDFYSFIKTMFIPRELKYNSPKEAPVDLAWLVAHWQQLAGVLLFLSVYGLIFARKE